MKTNHTPGQWEVGPSTVIGHKATGNQLQRDITHNGISVATIRYRADQPTQGEANARLIACAPELLQALENLCERRRKSGMPLDADCWQQAFAAIALAKGEPILTKTNRQKSCDFCRHQEGKHYCLLHDMIVKNMDIFRCEDWCEKLESKGETKL